MNSRDIKDLICEVNELALGINIILKDISSDMSGWEAYIYQL
jgi:hypothetical protein